MFNRFIIYFVRRYWFFVALGAVVVVVFFLWITRPRPVEPTPTASPRPSPAPLSGERLTGIFRLDPSLVLPTTQAPLFRLEKTSISPTKAVAIAKALGFTESPTVARDVIKGEFYSWTQPSQSLVVGLETASARYSRSLFLTPPPKIGPLPTAEEAQKVLLNLLGKSGLLPEAFSLEPQEASYLTFDGSQFIETSEEEAAFIQVSFLPKINERTITLVSLKVAPIGGRVTFGGVVQNFTYELPFTSLEPTETVSLKDRNQVQTSLFLEGRVISLEGAYERLDLAGLKEVVLTRAELVYPLASPPQEVLTPVFLLSGTAITREGESRQIQVYLPAVAR